MGLCGAGNRKSETMKFTVLNRSQSRMTLFLSTCLSGHSKVFFVLFLTRHFVLTGSMWSVVLLASEACWQQRTEHFMAGLWESPLMVFSLPLIKNMFYDLLLFGLCVLPRRFSQQNLLTPALQRHIHLLRLLVEMSEWNKQIHYSVCFIKTSQIRFTTSIHPPPLLIG